MPRQGLPRFDANDVGPMRQNALHVQLGKRNCKWTRTFVCDKVYLIAHRRGRGIVRSLLQRGIVGSLLGCSIALRCNNLIVSADTDAIRSDRCFIATPGITTLIASAIGRP